MKPIDPRQKLRDAAADAIAPRHKVIVPAGGWPPARADEPGLCNSERKRRYRARLRARA